MHAEPAPATAKKSVRWGSLVSLHLGHFAPRVAPQTANRKFNIQIAKPNKTRKKTDKTYETEEKLRKHAFRS